MEASHVQIAPQGHSSIAIDADPAAATVVVLDSAARGDAWPPREPGIVDRLRGLGTALQATRVALTRLHREHACFELVAATGPLLFAPGARFPITASSIFLAASEGRRSTASIEATSRPLDQMAATLGLRSALGLPLGAGGTVVGALAILWNTDQPSVSNPQALVIGEETELVEAVLDGRHKRRRILVCHEDPLTANGLARLAEEELGATATLAETLDAALAVLADGRPDLIVCSDHLAPGEPLRAIARRLRAAGAAAPLLVLARTDSTHSFESALDAGASGYLTLARAMAKLTATATKLLAGNSVLPTRVSSRLEPHLTERERDVLLCFERGLADKEIARALGVAISTVKTHARAIYAKLDVPSRTAALHKARVDGVL